jgi:FkbM family methyltransferase
MTELSPRVRARFALGKALARVPLSTVERARRAIARVGPLRPVAAVLRHRPLHDLTDFEVLDHPGLRLVATDSLLVRRVFWYGEAGYEGAEPHLWRTFCRRASRIVEIGANVGFYSVQAGLAAPTASVVAVEPHPDSAATVRANLALNGVVNVEVIEAAVVGRVDTPTVELMLPDRDRYTTPMGAYVSGADVANRPAGRAVRVAAVAAGTVLAGADLLKLDIEGLETDVLSSARAEIEAARPVIFVEVLTSAPRLRALIVDWHDTLDYVVFAIGTSGLHLLDTEQLRSPDPLPQFGTRDVVLVPQERVAQI